MRRGAKRSALGPSCLLAVVAACGAASEDADSRWLVPPDVAAASPSILVVTIDTLRADHLSGYGYFRTTSPFVDDLARESVVFEQAFAPIATTLPSHTSMFTGVYPHEHGILANIHKGQIFRRTPHLRTLAELLDDAGYTTCAVVSCLPLNPSFGLDTGFDQYYAQKRHRRAHEATDAALAFLETVEGDDAPYFLWVHYFDPHGPYDPPEPYDAQFRADATLRSYLDERRFSERAQRPTGQWNEAAEGVDGYDGEIAFVDQELRRLFDGATRLGLLEGAVVSILADHGEGLNQHGVAGHGLVWDEQLHVPWMMRIPGVAPRRIAAPVSLVDFAPTLLHVIDVPGEAAFLEQVSGVNRFRAGERALGLIGQTSPRQSSSEDIGYCLRTPDWKLHLLEDGSVLLFELARDPFELADVAADHPDVVQAMRSELRERLAAQRAVRVEMRRATREERSELRALGYGGDE